MSPETQPDPSDTAPADTAPADTAPADTAPADTAPANSTHGDARVHDSRDRDSSTAVPDLTVHQAITLLQFIISGMRTHPNPPGGVTANPADGAADTALTGFAAQLESDQGMNRDSATRLVEALLAAGTLLRDDQTQGIIEAGQALGVSPVVLERLD